MEICHDYCDDYLLYWVGSWILGWMHDCFVFSFLDWLLVLSLVVLLLLCNKWIYLQVYITDLWTEHTPWPFNQLPRSYSFLVKHGTLWKMTYYGTAPRVIHQPHFAAPTTFIARRVVTFCTFNELNYIFLIVEGSLTAAAFSHYYTCSVTLRILISYSWRFFACACGNKCRIIKISDNFHVPFLPALQRNSCWIVMVHPFWDEIMRWSHIYSTECLVVFWEDLF
jgi:hypothetical protein